MTKCVITEHSVIVLRPKKDAFIWVDGVGKFPEDLPIPGVLAKDLHEWRHTVTMDFDRETIRLNALRLADRLRHELHIGSNIEVEI